MCMHTSNGFYNQWQMFKQYRDLVFLLPSSKHLTIQLITLSVFCGSSNESHQGHVYLHAWRGLSYKFLQIFLKSYYAPSKTFMLQRITEVIDLKRKYTDATT